jgi:hypothetical protein
VLVPTDDEALDRLVRGLSQSRRIWLPFCRDGETVAETLRGPLFGARPFGVRCPFAGRGGSIGEEDGQVGMVGDCSGQARVGGEQRRGFVGQALGPARCRLAS